MDDKITVSTFQFLKRFPNAEAARSYLEARRWPKGAICPACGCIERIQTRTALGYFRCLNCKTDFTVRTGTIFERSHVPLDKWLYAMYLMATARKGISSLQLSKELGVTQKPAATIKMMTIATDSCRALLKPMKPTLEVKRPTSTSTRSLMPDVAQSARLACSECVSAMATSRPWC
jgi:transposase-like protein